MSRTRILPLFLALALAAPLPAQQTAAPAGDRFEPMDVFQLEYAADPRISPDGRQVVYARTFFDVMTDRARSNLWIVNADGSDHRPLTTGNQNDGSPRWSPDGRSLIYVSTEEGGSELWRRWMDSGQTAKLTNLTESPRGIAWSPDGTRIAFTMRVPDAAEPIAKLPRKPEGAEWAPSPVYIDDVVYRSDGGGYLKPGYTHVFVMPAEGGSPRQLTSGPYNHGAPVWTPDGQALIVSANRREEAALDPVNSELYEISVADGTTRALTDRVGPDGSPAVSPDGRWIAYTGFDDRFQGYQVAKLHVMPRAGGEARVLTATLDRDVDDPVWSADGKRIYFQYDDEGDTRIAYATLDGEVRDLADGLGGTSLGRPYGGGSFTVSQNGRFAYTLTSPYHPADVAVGGPRDGEVRRITRLNDDLLAHKTLGEVEEIWYDAPDGRRVQGWVVKPPGFDPARKYPLVLEIHGGPFANYGPRFAAEIQLYAADDYVVLYTNPRGSTSYGEEFGNLIHHAYPGDDYHDLIAGVDAVIARGYADPNRLFVTGGSGGGVLSAWIVGNTDRFRAAVVQKPVINWISWALTADMYPYGVRYWFPGAPWEHFEHYWKRSPLSLVGNVNTPTMLITGEEDYRTPIPESEQYYQALKLRRVPAALVRIPGASHGIGSRPSELIAKVAYVLAWFDRWDVGAEPARAAGS